MEAEKCEQLFCILAVRALSEKKGFVRESSEAKKSLMIELGAQGVCSSLSLE